MKITLLSILASIAYAARTRSPSQNIIRAPIRSPATPANQHCLAVCKPLPESQQALVAALPESSFKQTAVALLSVDEQQFAEKINPVLLGSDQLGAFALDLRVQGPTLLGTAVENLELMRELSETAGVLVKGSDAFRSLVLEALKNDQFADALKSLGASESMIKALIARVERNDLVAVSKRLSEHLVQVMQDNMDLWFGFAIVGMITVGSAAIAAVSGLIACCCAGTAACCAVTAKCCCNV